MAVKPASDLRSDLNSGDDDAELGAPGNAADPQRVQPDAVFIAGTNWFWSVVRVTAADDDGQVHFLQLAADDPAAKQLLAATS